MKNSFNRKAGIASAMIIFYFFAVFLTTAQTPCKWNRVTAVSNKFLQAKPKKDNSPYYDGRIIDDIIFTDNKKGWIVGGDNIVLTTSNGGMSWTSQSLGKKKVGNQRTTGVFFLNSMQGWIAGSENGKAIVYRTANGGKHWNILKRMEDSQASYIKKTLFINSRIGWGIGFIRNQAGESNVVWKTEDGGISWVVKYSENLNGDISDLEIVDDNIILVGTSESILQTTDGGKTWRKVYKPEISPQIGDFEFVSRTEGWAVGSQGLLLHTVDAGRSWQKINLPEDLTGESWFTAIKFLDEKRGWIAGTKEIILATADGGKSWKSERYRKNGGEVFHRLAKTSNHIFAVGTDGLILRRAINKCF